MWPDPTRFQFTYYEFTARLQSGWWGRTLRHALMNDYSGNYSLSVHMRMDTITLDVECEVTYSVLTGMRRGHTYTYRIEYIERLLEDAQERSEVIARIADNFHLIRR